jgi:formate hydrogenlyase regulatory protein HycA
MINLFRKSWIPKLLPIMREEDYHTHFIGRTQNGEQFFGHETFVLPKGDLNQEWEKSRKEYVVLYFFDSKGNHSKTNHWFAGKTAEIAPDATRNKLEEMVNELGEVEFRDIAIKPFKTVIDGVEFGLIPNEETQSIELQPSSTIVFSEPWNGEYFT